ncbi:MAG TPA: cytochrome P450 [Acidimicrobiales bacterium]|nr:cytochrome P450 [Acidimicrobiales bacterium]
MNLFEIALLDDPYPAYAELRESRAVHDGGSGYWYVTRYDEIQRLLRDPSLVSGTGVVDSLGLTEGPLYDVMTSWLMALDGNAHARVRRLISGVFTPRAVERMRPDVSALVAAVLDDLGHVDGSAPVDLVPALAFTVPIQVVRMLFGVDESEWRREVIAHLAPSADGPLDTMSRLIEYLERLVERRRAAPGDDMFSLLFAPDDTGERLSDFELVANGVLLITAGFETTMSMIGNSIVALLEHPAQADAVRDDPAQVVEAVEEALRWETPALTTSRRTTTAIEVSGALIPPDTDILFALAAGNRDPRRYDHPDRFDITRPDIRPLGFGGGLHVCIGAALARLETQVVVAGLLRRFPELALDHDGVRWRKDNPTVRGPATLPVQLRR